MSVLYPVQNLAEAIAFYRDGLGLGVRFTDGDRYASLEGGLALAGPDEDLTGGRPAAVFRVADVAITVERLTAAGARLVRGPEEGPHEIRAVLLDPAGNPLIIHAPRT